MTAQLVAVTFDAPDPDALAAFWGALLDRSPVPHRGAVLLAGTDTQVGLRFTREDEPRADAPHRLHLHVTSEGAKDQDAVVHRALELGATHFDVGQLPEEEHVVLADPAGNEFCVIEPHNTFLAGTGLLGELACDGHRAVGVFWSAALGWPLVWDSNEETAIQSPAGGTKVAWGGPPVLPHVGRDRQRFELRTDDLVTEVDRLVSLGATLSTRDSDIAVLHDPDGNEFALSASS